MGNFKELFVWQNAKGLAVEIYKLTCASPFKNDFGLKDQMQRAAVSISCNIAEGDELGTDRLSVRYFYIAKGSSAELMTQIIIANEIGYIDDKTAEALEDRCDKISSMLARLIQARSK
jgi:four helix bundle protein